MTAMMCHAELARTRPAGRPPDGVLSVALDRRRRRRRVQRARRAGRVRFGARVPARARARLRAAALRPRTARRRGRTVAPRRSRSPPHSRCSSRRGFRPFAHARGRPSSICRSSASRCTSRTGARSSSRSRCSSCSSRRPIVHSAERLLERHRSFFGVHSVLRDETGTFHVLMHGITIHGAQYIDPAKRTTADDLLPRGQPDRAGALGARPRRPAAARRRDRHGHGNARVPSRAGPRVDVLRDRSRSSCGSRATRATSTFSPSARRTRRSCSATGGSRSRASARRRVRPHRHRHFQLRCDSRAHDHARSARALPEPRSRRRRHRLPRHQPVPRPRPGARAARRGCARRRATCRDRASISQLDERLAALPSSWVAIARDPARLAPLVAEESWVPLPVPPPGRVWTDDFSNVLSALK